jgi:putative transposase
MPSSWASDAGGPSGDRYDDAAIKSLWIMLKRDLNRIQSRKTWTSSDLLRSAFFD